LAVVAVVVAVAPARASLPDGRVWEQVSPVAKNAGDVIPDPTRTHASFDGERAAFASFAGFPQAQGLLVSSDYLAVRDGSGDWLTHGITPRQDFAGYQLAANGIEPAYMAFSPDLSAGVLQTRASLTDAPNVAKAINLYRRDDALSASSESYTLLTDAASPQSPSIFPSHLTPVFMGASADFSHVLIETPRRLTGDAPACSSDCDALLYETVGGVNELVGILPPAEGGGAAPVSRAGSIYGDAISEDGSRAIFYVPDSLGSLSGALYLRDLADDSTIRIDVSESGTTLSGPSRFWAASSDASQIFFTNSGQIYRYDTGAPADQHLTLISVDQEPADSGPVVGAIGASSDGNYVYFITRLNQLVAGGPTGGTGGPLDGALRIFVWHDGAIHEVGGINSGAELNSNLGDGIISKISRVTPDGKHLVFTTDGTDELLSLYGRPNYNHGDSCFTLGSPACSEIYVYDAAANSGAGDLRCASCDPTGKPATAAASFMDSSLIGTGAEATSPTALNHPLSDDGRFVFFNTRGRLVPDDTNTTFDAYEYDTTTNEVHLLSAGERNTESLFLDASADGRDVFFASRDQLRSSDIDDNRDLYDARIGGVPDPGVSSRVACEGDSCRPAASAPLDQSSPSSEAFTGPGDRLQASPIAAFSVEPLTAEQRRVLAHRGRAKLTVRVSQPGEITVRLRARVSGRVRTIQETRRSLNDGSSIHVRLRLSKAARRRLAATGRLRLTILTSYSQATFPQIIRLTLHR